MLERRKKRLPVVGASRGRRQFLTRLVPGAAGLGAVLAAAGAKRILLRSSWATVNIGDIAHTPGMLALIEKYLPGVEVSLWPRNVGGGVDRLLLSEFPRLRIVRNDEELAEAFEKCDFLLHGSKASVGADDIQQWSEATGKPYGIYGVTFPRRKSTSAKDLTREQLRGAVEAASGARFVFFRDSKSLEFAREMGVDAPVMEFGPDAAFGCDLRDPEPARAFLKANGLREGKFLCCIPRLRYTPYWRIFPERDVDPVRKRRNEEMQEHDHAPLRAAIIEVVRNTGLKVLLCPEDKTHMAVARESLLDPLPKDVRERVVWKQEFWYTGEAISTYVRSAGLFGNEMHSPIMCISHGVPAIVCRFAEQTTKGYMWEDIGLGDWLFDHDDPSQMARLTPTVMEIAQDPAGAKAKTAKARQFVEKRQRETMERLAAELA